MYPSDYGYSTSSISSNDRTDCLNTPIYDWNLSSKKNCRENSYLPKFSSNQWILMPMQYGNNASANYAIGNSNVEGYENANGATVFTTSSNYLSTFPALYLKYNILVSLNSSGTIDDPFIIG